MLAQSFKSAADLGISEPQLSALQKTLVLLETGKLKHTPVPEEILSFSAEKFTGDFNMGAWSRVSECGSVCCLGGTAELVGGVSFHNARPGALNNLFYPPRPLQGFYEQITPAQAAIALRSYLTTGDAKWHEAVA